MTERKAQWVTIPFEVQVGGETVKRGLRMKIGTAEALGIPPSRFSVGYEMKRVERPAYRRRLYPGGPTVQVERSSKIQAVAVGPNTSGALTNSKFFLRGNGPNKAATIYFSGRRSEAVKFIADNTNIDWTLFGNSMGLYSSKGKLLVLKKGPIG